MNDLSFSSSFPTLLTCDIYQKAHSWKIFLYRKNPPPPPQLPFSAHKKQVEKRMASVGEVGGFMEGDDRRRYIYVCVKQKWNKKKWNIYAVLSNVYCFLFFYFLPFHLDFYI